MSNILKQYLEQKIEIDDLQREIEGLRQEIDGLNQCNSGLNQHIDSLNQEIANLNSENSNLYEKVTSLEDERDSIINEPYYIKAMEFRDNVKKTLLYKGYSRLRYGKIETEPIPEQRSEQAEAESIHLQAECVKVIETEPFLEQVEIKPEIVPDAESVPVKEFDYEHMLYSDEYRFLKYKQKRNNGFKIDINRIKVPYKKDLISVVLPINNDENYIESSIDSVLTQSYENFELIIVNQGSPDKISQMLTKYALEDNRIKVINQENQGISEALSEGFRAARGEFFTWLNAGNVMSPQMLEKFVNDLKKYNHTGMVYGNLKMIDENGEPNTEYGWCAYDPEHPDYALFQRNTMELNTYPNNYVGAAFMYRAVVANVVQDYSAFKSGIEDYDYWMKINELFALRHTSFDEPEYSYRVSSDSIRVKEDELISVEDRYKKTLWDDFRRDYLVKQQMWVVETDDEQDKTYLEFVRCLNKYNQIRVTLDEAEKQTKNLYEGFIYVKFVSNDNPDKISNAPSDMFRVLVASKIYKADAKDAWDCYVCTGDVTETDYIGEYKGWYGIEDGDNIFAFVDSKARISFLYELEAECSKTSYKENLFSVVVSYYGNERNLERCVNSIRQNNNDIEIIIVGQADEMAGLSGFDDCKKVSCLSENDITRKNVAARMAEGKYISFVQDDCIVDEEYFENVKEVFNVDKKIATVYANVEVVTNEDNRRFARMLGEYMTDKDTVYYYSKNDLPGITAFTIRNQCYKMVGGFSHCNDVRPQEFCGLEYMGMSIRLEIVGFYTMLASETKMLRYVYEVSREDIVSIWEKYINTRYQLEIKTDLPYDTWPESIDTDACDITFISEYQGEIATANKRLLDVVRHDLREKEKVELNREIFGQLI